METAVILLQIFVAVLIIIAVLLQVRGQGGGLFGSSESSYRTRRGLEKLLFQSTIVLTGIFIATSIVIASGLLT